MSMQKYALISDMELVQAGMGLQPSREALHSMVEEIRDARAVLRSLDALCKKHGCPAAVTDKWQWLDDRLSERRPF